MLINPDDSASDEQKRFYKQERFIEAYICLRICNS